MHKLTTNLFILLILAISGCECGKDDTEPKQVSNQCPVISNSEVPDPVNATFRILFKDKNPLTWHKKDDKGFVALIISDNEPLFIHFTKDGKFVKKQIGKNKNKKKHKLNGKHHKDKNKTTGQTSGDKDGHDEIDDVENVGDKDSNLDGEHHGEYHEEIHEEAHEEPHCKNDSDHHQKHHGKHKKDCKSEELDSEIGCYIPISVCLFEPTPVNIEGWDEGCVCVYEEIVDETQELVP